MSSNAIARQSKVNKILEGSKVGSPIKSYPSLFRAHFPTERKLRRVAVIGRKRNVSHKVRKLNFICGAKNIVNFFLLGDLLKDSGGFCHFLGCI